MSRRLYGFIFLAFQVGSVLFAVHELRTPLCLQSKLNLINGSFHYPIKLVEEEKTYVDVWAGAYYRNACKGYCPKVCDWCCSECKPSCIINACDGGCSTCNSGSSSSCFGGCDNNLLCLGDSDFVGCRDCDGKKVSLAKLFFGKSSFYGSEAFGKKDSAGQPISFENNSELTDILLIPRVRYKEKGVVVGIHAEKKLRCSKWRVGFSASLPIKNIQVVRDMSCEATGTGLIDVSDLKVEGTVIDPTKGKVFCKYEWLYDTDSNTFDTTNMGETCAYRLDFLRELEFPDGRPLVEFTSTGSVIIADVNLSTKESIIIQSAPLVETEPIYPAVAYRPNNDNIFPAIEDPYTSDNMTEPVGPIRISLAAVNAGIESASAPFSQSAANSPLPADGAIDYNERLYFDPAINYTPLEGTIANQEKIFIIPAYHRDLAINGSLYTRGGLQIKNVVDYILSQMDEEIEGDVTGEAMFKGGKDLFAEKGICLRETHCITGLGDLDTSIFFGYDPTEQSYVDFVVGVRFPTGKKNSCPGKVYFIPAGNNGHFEAKLGIEGGWRSKRWFGVRADASYSQVLEAVEKKPAAFTCATIRGIGPCVDAKVKWGYFLGHLDFTVFHPKNQNMGFAFGYEIYYKRHDKVQFCGCGGNIATDFLGNRVMLDSSLLEVNTNILAHKIRGQVYHRWNYFELYLGASKVIGGWNGMSENEVHIGCGINF